MDDATVTVTLIMAAIAGGAHTVAEIATACGGLYPGELQASLDRLVASGYVTRSDDHYALAHVTSSKPNLGVTETISSATETPELPEPHPLDYDWRFDLSTARRLATLLSQGSSPRQRILLLGAPSVFLEFQRLLCPVMPILLDRSAELVAYLSRSAWLVPCVIEQHDLLGGALWNSEHPLDAALCDPPWYPEHYAAFLAQAATALRLGGLTLVSLLPLNTRPGAPADRQTVLELAHELGFAVSALEHDALGYKTPPFERSSLTVANLDVPGDWRRGDLLSLIKVRPPDQRVVTECLEKGADTQYEDLTWREILFGRHKVKLRGPFDDPTEEPALLSIEAGDILPTVSRRYEGRQRVDLWLWDNRVFAVKGKAAFLGALHTLAGRPLPLDLPEVVPTRQDVARVALQRVLGEIVALPSRAEGPELIRSTPMASSMAARTSSGGPETREVPPVPLPPPNLGNPDCELGLHCFYNSRSRNNAGYPVCRYCGADVIEWQRLHQRDLADIAFTLSQLQREKCRSDWWTKDVDQVARNHALRKGTIKLQQAVVARLRRSVGEVHVLPDGTRRAYRDGYQTPLTGNCIYYAQHATACCCRKCMRCWHGIPVDRDLSEEEIRYFTALVMAFIHTRLPALTAEGQHIPPARRR